MDFLCEVYTREQNELSARGREVALRRARLKALDLLVVLVTELAAISVVAWLIYEIVVQWARMTGRL